MAQALAAQAPQVFPKPELVTVVGDRGFRPFHFTSHDHCVGIIVDLWQLWSTKTHVPIAFKCDYEWSAALDEVKQGRADVVGGLIKRDDRALWLDFPSLVITTYFHIYFHESLGALKDLDSLPDSVAIGVVKDDYPESIIRAKYGTHQIKSYGDHDALITGALRKEVLAFVLEPEVADYYFALKGEIPPPFKKAVDPFLDEELYAGVGKGKMAVSYWVRDGFQRISREERAAILQRWNYRSPKFRLRELTEEVRGHPEIAGAVAALIAYALLICSIWMFSQVAPVSCLRLEKQLRDILRFSFTLHGVKLELSLRGLLMLETFAYRPRVVDAWIRLNRGRAFSNFSSLEAVKTRASYTPLPIIAEGELITAEEPTVLERQIKEAILSLVAASRAPILISGEGGAGKTATAIRCVEWICGFGENCSPLGFPVLPAILEEDLEFDDKDANVAVVSAVQGVLNALIEAPLDEMLLRYMLKERRVCVLLDGLSERSERTRKSLQARQATFPLTLVIATSRFEQDECLGGVPVRSVLPTRIGGVHISIFLNRYLLAARKRRLFSNSEFYEACVRMSLITGNKEITPLFATLFAALLISEKETLSETARIESIGALIELYVVSLNARIRDGRLADHKVLSIAKWLAWIEVKAELSPRTMRRSEIIAADSGGEFTDEVEDYLERKLRLTRRVDATGERLRISFDPLAEYLAAMHIVSLALGGRIQELEHVVKFISGADFGAMEKKGGFLVALWEVWGPARSYSKIGSERVGKAAEKLASFVKVFREASQERFQIAHVERSLP